MRAWHALLAGIRVGTLVVFIETIVEVVVALVVPTGTFVELGVVVLNVMLDVDRALDVGLDKEPGNAFDDSEGAGVT